MAPLAINEWRFHIIKCSKYLKPTLWAKAFNKYTAWSLWILTTRAMPPSPPSTLPFPYTVSAIGSLSFCPQLYSSHYNRTWHIGEAHLLNKWSCFYLGNQQTKLDTYNFTQIKSKEWHSDQIAQLVRASFQYAKVAGLIPGQGTYKK